MASDYYPTDFSEDFEEISNINNVINKIIEILQPYSLLLKQKILHKITTKLNIIWKDHKTIETMISNLSKSLQIANLKEHQSGWFRSVIKAVSGNNTKNSKMAVILGIHRNSVLAAKQQQNKLLNNGSWVLWNNMKIVHNVEDDGTSLKKFVKDLCDDLLTK